MAVKPKPFDRRRISCYECRPLAATQMVFTKRLTSVVEECFYEVPIPDQPIGYDFYIAFHANH